MQIGTCSWKYESWEGLVYSTRKPKNYLEEYSRRYRTVEVDQWFWSLFPGDKVALPKPEVVQEYASSIPPDFTFCVKVPNSITLTHHYKKGKTGPLQPNPFFLSLDLMNRFLDNLEPLHANLGPLIFQFEYLNKQKMAGLSAFIDQFGTFAAQLPEGFSYCVELRNPNWLHAGYFEFLNESRLYHVFLQGYYMPSIFALYGKFREKINVQTVIRLHGPDRQGIEKQTGKNWNQVVAPKNEELESLRAMLDDLQSRNVNVRVYVNNHYEGSAPMTIERILHQGDLIK